MSYSFDVTDQSLSSGIRRIALDQIESALQEAADDAISEAERIHQLRKRCKKLRGLIRIVRPGFADYSAENDAFRDIAARLSDVRDARALVETCEAVTGHFAAELDGDAFAGVIDHFERQAQSAENAPDLGDRLSGATTALKDARARVEGWAIHPDDASTLEAGIAKTYGRGVKAMQAARKTPTGETLHEWRKRTKYHWYHLRLLKGSAAAVKGAVEPADDLSDLLGDHHDIHVMAEALEKAGQIADPVELDAFRALIRARQDQLEQAAFDLGREVFAESPKAAARRLAEYWSAWRQGAAEVRSA